MDAQAPGRNRYHRQMLLPQIGLAGQERLAQARVLLIGCGALGSVLADQLVRAGVGWLRLADRDLVEVTNLQRQVLFDEADAQQALPKAVAAARRLGRVNSAVEVDAVSVDVNAGNLEELIELVHEVDSSRRRVDLILDGTDNVETRYLINDVAVKHSIPWVYGACIGTEGRVMAIQPARTPCLRCVFPDPPRAGELPTCDTAGVLGAAAAIVASVQASLALRILVGGTVPAEMLTLDAWESRFYSVAMEQARREDCPACALRRFVFLEAPEETGALTLCGRNAVQVRPPRGRAPDVASVLARLGSAGTVERGAYFSRCHLHDPEGIVLTVFPDGRVIIQGTSDLGRARSLAARFLGI